MRETCQKCNRPTTKQHTDSLYDGNVCGQHPYDPRECKVAAAAYRRGVLRGVEIAKEHAGILFRSEPDDICINWTRVDREAAKLAGDG